MRITLMSGALAPVFAAALAAAAAFAQSPAPLRVCATTTDLAALCRSVGGDDVLVTAFARGPEDPHFLEVRPSALPALHRADLLVDVGRGLEDGWLPLLVTNARNAAIAPGGPGRLTAGELVRRLGLPAGPVDRGHGDVHAGGNPHFCVDPLCGLQIAAALARRFGHLRPDRAAAFADGLQRLRHAVAVAAFGARVAGRYGDDAEKLLRLLGAGKLEALLDAQGDLVDLGGWAEALRPFRGAKLVADHDLWPYFAERFGLDVVAFLEPRPGVAPTSAHLQQVVEAMRRLHVQVILSAPWFAQEHAEFAAGAAGATVVAMAPQVGARDGTDDYVGCIDYDVRAIAAALAGGGR